MVDESPDNSSADESESEDANIPGKSSESSSLERRIEVFLTGPLCFSCKSFVPFFFFS